MKLSIFKTLFVVCALGLAIAGCATDEPRAPEAATSTEQSTVSCTPGTEMCDFGCGFDGSEWNGPTPSSDDCIIRCNAAGNAWQLVENCGWAQNFPYSASCLDAQPHPRCENN